MGELLLSEADFLDVVKSTAFRLHIAAFSENWEDVYTLFDKIDKLHTAARNRKQAEEARLQKEAEARQNEEIRRVLWENNETLEPSPHEPAPETNQALAEDLIKAWYETPPIDESERPAPQRIHERSVRQRSYTMPRPPRERILPAEQGAARHSYKGAPDDKER